MQEDEDETAASQKRKRFWYKQSLEPAQRRIRALATQIRQGQKRERAPEQQAEEDTKPNQDVQMEDIFALDQGPPALSGVLDVLGVSEIYDWEELEHSWDLDHETQEKMNLVISNTKQLPVEGLQAARERTMPKWRLSATRDAECKRTVSSLPKLRLRATRRASAR